MGKPFQLIPARGRKLETDTRALNGKAISTYPRKGTKTRNRYQGTEWESHFNLSPQGDENTISMFIIPAPPYFNLSPQGDENLLTESPRYLSGNISTYPRKGTKTNQEEHRQALQAEISTYPRKGTETLHQK